MLQELTIPVVPLKECNDSYSKLLLSNFPKGITNLFICAGVKEGGKDACQVTVTVILIKKNPKLVFYRYIYIFLV